MAARGAVDTSESRTAVPAAATGTRRTIDTIGSPATSTLTTGTTDTGVAPSTTGVTGEAIDV